jgi:hypothetical protein
MKLGRSDGRWDGWLPPVLEWLHWFGPRQTHYSAGEVRCLRERNEIERLFRCLNALRRTFSCFERLEALFFGFLNSALIIEALRLV